MWSRLSSQWVLDARWDIFTSLSTVWFPAAIYLLWLGVDQAGRSGGEVSLAVFTAAVSIPHFITTFSFTYLDPDQRRHYRTRPLLFYVAPFAILIGSWAYCSLVGPVLLVTIWVLFGEHHVAAQNLGFAALYRQRNKEGEIDRRIDHLVFNSAWITTCFIYGTRPLDSSGLLYLGRPAYSLPLAGRNSMLLLLSAFAAACFVAYLGRQLQRWWRGDPVSVPKLLFMLTTWPSFLVVPYVVNDVAVAQIVRSGYHSVQYLALVHLLNVRRVAVRPQADRGVLGLLVGRGPLVYFLLHAAAGIGIWLVTEIAGNWAGWPSTLNLRYLFFPGLVLFHYFVDGLTWRFSEPHARTTVLPYLQQRAPAETRAVHVAA